MCVYRFMCVCKHMEIRGQPPLSFLGEGKWLTTLAFETEALTGLGLSSSWAGWPVGLSDRLSISASLCP